MAFLDGSETLSNVSQTTQVYKATHDGAGNSLPYMDKSFISFTFGGKAIEDFDLIVVNSSDRMERAAYASFSDLTSTYDTLDGQLYWGTKIEPNSLELVLATDGMTEVNLDEFRKWFAPGVKRELILSEHPNRAIFARVGAAPVLSVLPFEKQTSIKINGTLHDVSTTVYRGEIQLAFVMDEPFWHAKLNYMPTYLNKKTWKAWRDNDSVSDKVITLNDPDMLKIMLEDDIPHQSVLNSNLFLGDNQVVTAGNPSVITTTSTGLALTSSAPKYLFYSGTTKSYPIIEFSIAISGIFDNDGYIKVPKNKIQNPSLTQYSMITVGDSTFIFTTPSILTAYNKAIQIFQNNSSATPVELITLINQEVNEYYARAWAIKCASLESNQRITNMKKFLNNSGTMTFIINSKTGEAIGQFPINMAENSQLTANYSSVVENVGDMICSNYLVIEERNYLNSNGNITTNECKTISTNETLTNFLIFFKNMYL